MSKRAEFKEQLFMGNPHGHMIRFIWTAFLLKVLGIGMVTLSRPCHPSDLISRSVFHVLSSRCSASSPVSDWSRLVAYLVALLKRVWPDASDSVRSSGVPDLPCKSLLLPFAEYHCN